MNCCWKRGWHMDAVKSSGESPGITEHSFRSFQSFVQWTEVLFIQKVCRRPTQIPTSGNRKTSRPIVRVGKEPDRKWTHNPIPLDEYWFLPLFSFCLVIIRWKQNIFYSTYSHIYIYIYNTSEINTAKFSRKKVHFWCSARDLCPIPYFKPTPLWSLAA